MKRLLPPSFGLPASLALISLALSTPFVTAQNPSSIPRGGVHYLFNSQMPPGQVGQARLGRWGAVQNYPQPVRFSGPEGTRFSLPAGPGFPDAGETKLMAGLYLGQVYRFKITNIPGEPGAELFPTVEIIDRTFPPPGQALRFPIPLNLTRFDLADALAGKLVTRVIYLEDTATALPVPETIDTARGFDVDATQDPLQVADQLGRPVAIIRIGSLVPPTEISLMPQFLLGSPPWVPLVAPPETEPEPAAATGEGQASHSGRPATTSPRAIDAAIQHSAPIPRTDVPPRQARPNASTPRR